MCGVLEKVEITAKMYHLDDGWHVWNHSSHSARKGASKP